MATRLYGGYVTTLAKRIEAALAQIQVSYNFDRGDEFEVAICNTLRRALPHKYGICRGLVVNAEGEEAGDDIIIYDRARFPTLRLLSDEDYALKERIPVEAVYAYIEAKHSLVIEGEGDSSLQHAYEQVSRVKVLCGRREPVPLTQISQIMFLPGSPKGREGYPDILNPVFTMVLARHVRLKPNQVPLSDPLEIMRRVASMEVVSDTVPDAAIMGKHNVLIPVLPHTGDFNYRFRSPFFLDGRSTPMCCDCRGIAFGVGLCMLLFALDQTQLGEMPWTSILQNAVEGKASDTE